MGVVQHTQTICYVHYFASLTKQGWFQGHRFRALVSNAIRVPVWREIANPRAGKKQLAVSAVNVCQLSKTHHHPINNQPEVEPVWSYSAFEWLLFPTFPSHDIHMISWSVPGFSPTHWCILHQDLKKSPMIPSPASPLGPALPSLLWSRCPNPEQGRVDMQYPEAEAPTPSTCTRLRKKNFKVKVEELTGNGYLTMKEHVHWKSYMKQNTINRSSP